MEYTLHMRDECGSRETTTIEADDLPGAVSQIEAECGAWVEGVEWGTDGASVWVGWTLDDADGDEVDDGSTTIEIEPDHESLISDAGGDSDCDHDWTAEGEGGCSENPGVWSTGGTSMTFRTHCRHCGLIRIERSTGSQCNPGEHDTVRYITADADQIAAWRADGAMDEEAD